MKTTGNLTRMSLFFRSPFEIKGLPINKFNTQILCWARALQASEYASLSNEVLLYWFYCSESSADKTSCINELYWREWRFDTLSNTWLLFQKEPEAKTIQFSSSVPKMVNLKQPPSNTRLLSLEEILKDFWE